VESLRDRTGLAKATPDAMPKAHRCPSLAMIDLVSGAARGPQPFQVCKGCRAHASSRRPSFGGCVVSKTQSKKMPQANDITVCVASMYCTVTCIPLRGKAGTVGAPRTPAYRG
jgi:hypothetical protein